MLNNQTLRDIWSILLTANPGGQVELESNEHKLYYDPTPEIELTRCAQYINITDEERSNCIARNTMWVLTLRTVDGHRAYIASSLSALVEIYRQHETFVEMDGPLTDLETLARYLQTPYLSTGVIRDAHAAAWYSFADDPDQVKHTYPSIRAFLEEEEASRAYYQCDVSEEVKGPVDPDLLAIYESDHLWQYRIFARTPGSHYALSAATLPALLGNLPVIT